MRTARILADPSAGVAYYHLITRAIEGRFIFDELAKEKFRRLLYAYGEMMGIELLTWCCLSNHFHLLVRLPNAEEFRAGLDDQEILRRLGLVTAPDRMLEIAQTLEELRTGPPEFQDLYLHYRQRLLNRMADVSVFMRELKQRFTQWHNRRVKRKGPLWEDRFKSVLVEEHQAVLITMAAYIDLNPVRAGLVKDPKDYRWCGYAEAVAGRRQSRRGLKDLYVGGNLSWKACQGAYRCLLFAEGEARPAAPGERGVKARAGFTALQVEAVEKRGGSLSAASLLQVRVRHFTRGLALGRREFVEEVFSRNRGKMGVKRKAGAREAKGAHLGEWRTLVDLRGE